MPRLSREVWSALFRGSLVLAAVSFGAGVYFRSWAGLLGGEAPSGFANGSFLKGAWAAMVFAAVLWGVRPRRRLAPAARMPCGGAMSELSFSGGADYGYCSKRCVHSRADFEARRGYEE